MKIYTRNSIFTLLLGLSLVACGSSSSSDSVPTTPSYQAFVTSAYGRSNFGAWADAGGQTGLAAADAICQAHAGRGGLSGTYRAWLSDSSDDAYCRMHNLTGKKAANCGQGTLPTGAGPWVRMDGFPFAGTIEQMLAPNGMVVAPVAFNEYGPVVGPPPISFTSKYLTNTTMTGEASETVAGNICDDFTTDANLNFPSGGSIGSTGYGMTQGSGGTCNTVMKLLCMRTGTGAAALPVINGTGKIVFVTSQTGTGNLSSWTGSGMATGVAAGNAVCNSAATNAGITGTFKAWLSDNVTDAVNHITSDGPWVRVDGVTIATSKADLIDGGLFSSINVTENGDYVFDSMSSRRAWTGTDEAGTATVRNKCAEWTDGTAGSSADVGNVDGSGSSWSNKDIHNCNETNRLYCLED